MDFFWSGQHWIRASALYLPVEGGGQGLIDIPNRIRAFRLQAAQRLLYNFGLSWQDTARLLLRRAGRLGYDKQPELVDLTGLTPFYLSVLHSWQVFKAHRELAMTPGMWLFEEPLFYTALIKTQILSSASLRSNL